jgi:hypothetical protein
MNRRDPRVWKRREDASHSGIEITGIVLACRFVHQNFIILRLKLCPAFHQGTLNWWNGNFFFIYPIHNVGSSEFILKTYIKRKKNSAEMLRSFTTKSNGTTVNYLLTLLCF